MESEVQVFLITPTTVLAASLYEGGQTVQILVALGADDKDRAENGTSSSPKFGPRSHRAEFLREIALIIVEEASMLDPKLFKMG